MEDQAPANPDRAISAISHLFLSSPEATEDANVADEVAALAEELHLDPAVLYDGPAGGEEEVGPLPALGRPVRAVIGAGMNGSFFTRGREYAAHLVAGGGRVGLVQIDADEIRLHLVEHDADPATLPPERPRPTEGDLNDARRCRRITEALSELDYDVDRWLVLLPDPRHPEAKRLLAELRECVVLATADHDGVVAGYRTVKGLCEEVSPSEVAVALVDATDDGAARRVHHKLAEVCRQFLNVTLEDGGRVRAASTVAEHNVLWFRARSTGLADDAAVPSAAPQWGLLGKFLADGRAAEAAANAAEGAIGRERQRQDVLPDRPVPTEAMEPEIQEDSTMPFKPVMREIAPPAPTPVADAGDDDLVTLASGSPADVARGYLQRQGLEPLAITPPQLPEAVIAVSGGVLQLVAVTGSEPHKLDACEAARVWLGQSAAVIALALPAANINVEATPRLTLLIRDGESSAPAVRHAAAQVGVSVVPHRTLKWSGRVGLLLAA
jgi:hypothetical protein